MSMLLAILVGVLAIWMLAAAWCGYRASLWRFAVVLLIGLGLNMAWMVLGLDARPFERHALVAQAAATLYALCAFGLGWLVGRFRRAWDSSRVD
jgi:hypothetical protein